MVPSGRMNTGGQQHLRFLRAYWVTLVVLSSYAWIRVLATFRHDAWTRRALQRAHTRNARRIQGAIVRLQGLFIKVGQTFSILVNFLPDEFRRELEGLQDAVPPRAFEAIRARFREDFGQDPHDIFAEFAEVPIAAASISQVHEARTRDGERVAVKVQYPDIDRMVRDDLKTFRRILALVSWFYPARGFDVVYREVSQMVLAELDFAEEAQHIERIGGNFRRAHLVDVHVPRVYHEYSTRRILTTGYVDGCKVSDVERLAAAGHDGAAIAARLVDVYCQQIFVDGYYHADPHPGNILIGDDGSITLVDFGAVAWISQGMRKGIADFLQAVINQNTEKIAQALKDMGFIARPHNEEVFDQVIAYFHERFQESITVESFNLNDIHIDPDMGLEHLLALREMDIGLGDLSSAFQIPSEWILLERTILLLTGLCTLLAPEIRPMERIRPYLRDFVVGEDGDWSTFVMSTGREVVIQFLGLPAELRKFLTRATSGRIELRVRDLPRTTRVLYTLGHQVILALFALGGAGVGAYLEVHGVLGKAEMAWRVAQGASALLVLSMWRQSRRFRRR